MPKLGIGGWPPFSPEGVSWRDGTRQAAKLMMNAALTLPVAEDNGAIMTRPMGLGPVKDNSYFEPGSCHNLDVGRLREASNARRVMSFPSLFVRFLGTGK